MRIFITGGAGFIGCNLAHAHLDAGDDVVVFDNLSRIGTQRNLDWLQASDTHSQLTFIKGDVRNAAEIVAALAPAPDVVYHMAGQVAVTTSVESPMADFEINALGTINVLEAIRAAAPEAIVLYASTNKVYGELPQLDVEETETGYRYADLPFGVAETQALDFHSPYGCSKGSGDQYVHDYARIYGLRTVVFRKSCIYGTRQFGVEDQGWLAHFCIAAVKGRSIRIYGNGKQVRDLLWIEDLVAAYRAAVANIDDVAGSVFNIGGGPDNALSIWQEFKGHLEEHAGSVDVDFHDWRPGDQKLYISDIRKAQQRLGWAPSVSPSEGVERLCRWIKDNPALFT